MTDEEIRQELPEDLPAEPQEPATIPPEDKTTAPFTPEPEACPTEEPEKEKPEEPEDITPRLADEFVLLAAEVPELNSPEQLPDAVLDMAAREDIHLFDAWLRFRWQEEKRAAAEEERRRTAAERSAGSLFQGAGQPQPEQEAFLRAFRKALR